MTTAKSLVTPRRLIVAGAVLAAVLLVVGIGFTALSAGHENGTTGTADGSTRRSAAPSSSAAPGPSSSAQAIGPSAAPSAGPRTATEVQAEQTAAPTLPPSAKREPLVSTPFPSTASASKKLVAGFPAALALKPSSTIVNSSVSSSGTIMQATLTAITDDSGDEVIAYYEKLFAKIGLAGSPVPSVGGTESYSFARGNDSVTLTVTPSKKQGSTYVLFGVLNASA